MRKRLHALELPAACQMWLELQTGTVETDLAVDPTDVFPALRSFLLESGLQRSVKSLDKDTATEEETPAPKGRKRLRKRLVALELIAACQAWLAAQAGAAEAPAEADVKETAEADAEAPAKKKKKAVAAEVEEETRDDAAEVAPKKKVAEAEAEPPRAEEKASKKRKRTASDVEAAEKPHAAEEPQAAEEAEEAPTKKRKNKNEKAPKSAGVPFSRIDYDKCVAMIKDPRMMDNTHLSKQKFGGSIGDTWADRASEDMLKVKGKGFRKEMQKKKRASWRGSGELDQGVNSIKFAGSSDEE